MKKKLPVKVKSSVQTECWTYNKLAIIEAHRSGVAWTSSHFGLFMGPDYRLLFGKINKIFDLNYFSDILSFNEINYWTAPPDRLIDILIENLQNDIYMIIYMQFNVREPKVHEYLFYGFDTEQKNLFFLQNVEGSFREEKMSFDLAKEYYKNYYDFHLTFPCQMTKSIANFFPVTKVALKNDFNEDICVIETLRRFEEERYGVSYIDSEAQNNETAYYFTGLKCVIGMKMRVAQYIRDQQFIKGDILQELSFDMQRNFNKLYEHDCIVLKSMYWLMNALKYDGEQQGIDEYKNSLKVVNKIAALSIKFWITGNWNNIYRIRDLIDNLYERQEQAMDMFFETTGKAREQKNLREYNALLKLDPEILNKREHFTDEE